MKPATPLLPVEPEDTLVFQKKVSELMQSDHIAARQARLSALMQPGSLGMGKGFAKNPLQWLEFLHAFVQFLNRLI